MLSFLNNERVTMIYTIISKHLLLATRNYVIQSVSVQANAQLLLASDHFQKDLDILDPHSPCAANSLHRALSAFYRLSLCIHEGAYYGYDPHDDQPINLNSQL